MEPVSQDPGSLHFQRAEAVLQQVVEKYSRQKSGRSRRSWAKDYLSELQQVQVLYRDITRLYPGLSGRSMSRTRQVRELMDEIRNFAL